MGGPPSEVGAQPAETTVEVTKPECTEACGRLDHGGGAVSGRMAGWVRCLRQRTEQVISWRWGEMVARLRENRGMDKIREAGLGMWVGL